MPVRSEKCIVRLEGNKRLNSYGIVLCTLEYGKFRTEEEFTVLDLEHKIFLGKPFWTKGKVLPNYKNGGIIVHDGTWKHFLNAGPVQELPEDPQLRTLSVRNVVSG